MVNLLTIYDLTFFAIFTLVAILFLYVKRENLQREGLLYLYRTKFGLNFIEWTNKKFAWLLRPLEYVMVASGFILMAGMIWFLIKFSWFYLTTPFAAEALKIPVLLPLIPYLPTLFNLDFLPQFYFTYWIIIIAIIAIPHEFAHGIFSRLHNIKVKSTGFGFLGPFLAAFVEPDEKQMAKTKKFNQMSILAAGTFANILMTVLFGILLWLFFIVSFVPTGVNFNDYSTTIINSSEVAIPSEISDSEAFIEVYANNQAYFTSPIILKRTRDLGLPYLEVYENSPAFSVRLSGAISEINGVPITSFDDLSTTIKSYQPGEMVTVKTLKRDLRQYEIEETEYDLTLGERDGQAFLGIGIRPIQSSGLLGSFYSFFAKIKSPFIFYESNSGAFGFFIYDLLWWIVLINISVALVNMLPVGIFDGGKFFYLAIWGLTGSERIGRNAYKFSTWFIIGIIALLMARWVMIFF